MNVTASLYKVTRTNTRIAELSATILSGKASWDSTRATPMALDLTIRDQDAIDPYTDFIAPFLTVSYEDGFSVTEQVGLYSVAPFSVEHFEHYHEAKLDGRDLTWLLDDDHLEDGYNLDAGSNIIATVAALLEAADLTRINITPSTKTLPEARSWKVGTSRRQVIDDLLVSIGYVKLYFDRTGIACSSPYVSIKTPRPSVTYTTAAPTTTYEYEWFGTGGFGEGPFGGPNVTAHVSQRVRVLNSVHIDPLVTDVCNKVTVVKDNANEDPIVVTVRNTNPSSQTSITNTGRVISKTIRDSQVIDEASALTMALKELEEGATINHRLSLTTTLDPTRNMHEHYALNVVNAHGQAVAVGNFACTGWVLGFTPSDVMEHTVVDLNNPPMETN